MGVKKNIKKKAALGKKKNTKTNACVLVFVGVCSRGVSSHVYVYMCVWGLMLSMCSWSFFPSAAKMMPGDHRQETYSHYHGCGGTVPIYRH
jgi:hypothetical protein